MAVMVLLAVVPARAALSQARRGVQRTFSHTQASFSTHKTHSSKPFQPNSLYPFSGQITDT